MRNEDLLSYWETTCTQAISQMPHCPTEPGSLGWGGSTTFSRRARLLLQSEELPRPWCQLWRGTIYHQLRKPPWELRGNYESLHTLSSHRYQPPWTIIWKSCFDVFGKECFPGGIRLSGSKSRSSPWWAVYLGVGCAPTLSANAVLRLSHRTWSGTRPQTEAMPLAIIAQEPYAGDLKENTERTFNSFVVD